MNGCNVCRNMVYTSRGWECIYTNGTSRIMRIMSNPGGFCVLRRKKKEEKA